MGLIPIPFVLPLLYLVLVHAKVVRKLMPDRLGNHISYVFLVIFGSILNGELKQGYGVRKCHADSIRIASRRLGNAMIQTEQCLVLGVEPIRPQIFVGRLVLNEESDVLNLVAYAQRQPFKAFCDHVFEFSAKHNSRLTRELELIHSARQKYAPYMPYTGNIISIRNTSMKTSSIEVYQDKAKKFRFRLVAKNGETVAASEAYVTKAAAVKTAKKLAETAAKAEYVDHTVVAKVAPKAKK